MRDHDQLKVALFAAFFDDSGWRAISDEDASKAKGTHSASATANASMLSWSRFVVGLRHRFSRRQQPARARHSLIERQHAAILTKRIGQSQSDDDRGEHLLSSTATAAHVEFDRVLDHDDTVVVDLSRRRTRLVVIRSDTNRIDVCLDSQRLQRSSK